MSAFPTGNELADTNVLLQLNDQDLGRVCRSSAYLNSLCSNDYFWRLKLERECPQFLSLKNQYPSYRELYRRWARNQVYVVYNDEFSIVKLYNNIEDAYEFIRSKIDQLPPIERADELSEIGGSSMTLPVYIYALPEGEEVIGRDPTHILLNISSDRVTVSSLLAKMPVLEPDIFIIYGLVLSDNTVGVRVAKLTHQHMEEMHRSAQKYYGEVGYLAWREFGIQRSDTQVELRFTDIIPFGRSDFFVDPHDNLIIFKDNNGEFLMTESVPKELIPYGELGSVGRAIIRWRSRPVITTIWEYLY